TARDGAAYLADGILTGSTLAMDRAVGNLVGWGWTIERALEAATARPGLAAGLLPFRLDDPEADRIALDPDTLEVRGVWIAGEHVFGS
ncbi:MAG: N-acetylglucosamine-6-phosphate deacetylase, partial [Acidimicrobiia bacterium]